MAGTYANVPAARIPYDRDGSVGVIINSTNQATVMTSGQMMTINNESSADSVSPGSGIWYVAILFAQPMTIGGTFHACYTGGHNTVTTYISTDTTNGVDGTWTTFRSAIYNPTVTPDYRTSIFSAAAVSNVKAIKYNIGSIPQLYCIHVYGTPSAYTGDKLVFWHPTLDQALDVTPAYFDYGDVAQNAAAIERDFRLKNISSSLSANSITVSCEAPTDSSPTTYVSQTAFRFNGGSYGPTASMATLAPGEISSVFTAKLAPVATSALSVWTQRYIAEAANWS